MVIIFWIQEMQPRTFLLLHNEDLSHTANIRFSCRILQYIYLSIKFTVQTLYDAISCFQQWKIAFKVIDFEALKVHTCSNTIIQVILVLPEFVHECGTLHK
jgi:hypothetical protein